jgi:hypothetical protein
MNGRLDNSFTNKYTHIMLSIKLENIYKTNMDTLYASIQKKYKIPKSKLKSMWMDRDLEIAFQEFTPRIKKGQVLEMLKQLKVTEKIVRIQEHYVHPPSGFIFNPITRKVIGRKNNDSDQVRELTESDLEDCKQWKFDYIIPINLGKPNDNNDTLEKAIEQIHLGDDDSDVE